MASKATTMIFTSLLSLSFVLLISTAESRAIGSIGFPSQPDLACNQVYGAQSGDTCFSIMQNFHLDAETFGAINPNLVCNKMFVGEWICVDGVSSSSTSQPSLACNQVYGAQSGDTCFSVSQNFHLTAETFAAINPNLVCEKIFVGEWLCVDGAAS